MDSIAEDEAVLQAAASNCVTKDNQNLGADNNTYALAA